MTQDPPQDDQDTASRGPGRPRSEASRQAILDAAYALLQEKPLPEITSAALAKRAGVGKATLYRWWSSKEAIVLEAYFEALDSAIATPCTQDALGDLREHLRQAYAAMAGPDGQVFASLVASGHFHPHVREALNEELNSPRCQDTEDLLRRAIAEGRLAVDLDPELAVEMLFGPAFFRLMTGAPVEAHLADAALDLLVRAHGA
jgi:AcrR family transcriptional regulator